MQSQNPFELTSRNLRITVKKIPPEEGGMIPTAQSDEMLGVTVKKSQLNIVFIVFSSVIILFFARSFYLQLSLGDDLRALAEENRIQAIELKPERGFIFDRNNNILVKNEPHFVLEVTPGYLEKGNNKRNDLYLFLSKILNIGAGDVKKIIEMMDQNSVKPEILLENIAYEDAIRAKIQSEKFPGLFVGIETKRKYLHENAMSLSHVLGYVGRIQEKEFIEKNSYYSLTDFKGLTGVESFYEESLRGVKGKEEIEVNSVGKVIRKISYQKPLPGKNLTMTIDLEIQKKLEESIRRGLSKTNSKRAAGVALDPRTGEILALVSLPAYDNNLFSQGLSKAQLQKYSDDPDQPLFNRILTGQYPSGSTFKLIVGLAALEEDIINKNTTIQSVGGLKINQWFFPDWKAGGHGPTNITKALAESVNTFFYYVGGGYNNFLGLGVEKINYYGSLAGLGKKTGIDLPGESRGLLPSPEWKIKQKNERWYIGDTYHLAIGQGDILVTPLQVALWTSVIANGGTLSIPHLLKAIYDPEKNSLKKIEPKIVMKEKFKKENLAIIQEGMRAVITRGSAQSAFSLPIKIAGKTGTAEWSDKKNTHAWFTSYAPYENPTIVLAILIEEGGEGSSVAVPIANDFYGWWSKYAQIE